MKSFEKGCTLQNKISRKTYVHINLTFKYQSDNKFECFKLSIL